jgi:hypothetical protein
MHFDKALLKQFNYLFHLQFLSMTKSLVHCLVHMLSDYARNDFIIESTLCPLNNYEWWPPNIIKGIVLHDETYINILMHSTFNKASVLNNISMVKLMGHEPKYIIKNHNNNFIHRQLVLKILWVSNCTVSKISPSKIWQNTDFASISWGKFQQFK